VTTWQELTEGVAAMTVMTATRAGVCRDADPDLFFPISSVGRSVSQIAQAKAICACCPVRRECQDFATANAPLYGIWGGTTLDERQQARRG
jgi:WhiB family transcriptional regulator, redox-sensing transcriptional regulator